MNFKKLLPIIICITMLLTIMVSAYSDEDGDIIQRTECGKNLQWKISGDTLIISGTGEMYSFNQHGSNIVLPPWYKQKYEHIIIENGVEDISSFAFSYEVFTSITIPNSVKEIGDYAFYDSCDLSDVYYQGTEAEWKKIKIYSENIYLETATIHFLPEPDTTVPVTTEEVTTVPTTTAPTTDAPVTTTAPVTTVPVTTAPVTTPSVTTSQDKGTTADTDVATGDTEDLTTDSEISSAPEITSPDTDMPVEDTEEIQDTTKDDSAPSAESKKDTSDENASVSTSDDTSDSEGTSTGIIVAAAAGTVALAGGAGAFIFFKKYK